MVPHSSCNFSFILNTCPYMFLSYSLFFESVVFTRSVCPRNRQILITIASYWIETVNKINTTKLTKNMRLYQSMVLPSLINNIQWITVQCFYQSNCHKIYTVTYNRTFRFTFPAASNFWGGFNFQNNLNHYHTHISIYCYKWIRLTIKEYFTD